jgi:hypothetical protein
LDLRRKETGVQTLTPILEETSISPAAAGEESQIDPGIQPLVAALRRIGCQTEASCEGHLERLSSGEPCTPRLPYVVFRSPGDLVTDILDLAAELYSRPTRARLCYVWYVESCPSMEGGVVHTLTPHFAYGREQLTEADLQAAQRDSHTLAAFLLLRRGQRVDVGDRSTPHAERRVRRPFRSRRTPPTVTAVGARAAG